ncbi:hypothetical protein K435DRAFT_840238 [Dendrothele bispora CBS 962.96]|uniref:Uncharacterized protein n=1 Tax=Dendrothele bispora (strain CBS 962.96) TaxID=1314807 RepID=A0A4S8LV93_DENBC|nr:hypothetical protein K435DRAFT_840238 [Dendrothele bispora CBS 962.96]
MDFECPQCHFVAGRTSTRVEDLSPAALQLLKSNKKPTETVASNFREYHTQAKTALREIDTQIARLRASLELLMEERRRLDSIESSYKSILHPIRAMPDEILGEIFLHCVPHSSKLTRRSHPTNSLHTTEWMPWVLGQVCSRWRTLSTASPQLWSYVGFTIPSPGPGGINDKKSTYMLWLLSLQLQRSTPQPITLHITADAVYHNHPALIVICAHSFRWKKARLTLSFQSFQSLIPASLPSLEILIVSIKASPNSTIPADAVIDAFQNAPRLHDVTVHQLPQFPSKIRLPWSQIQLLRCMDKFRITHNEDYLKALTQTPHVKALSCACYWSNRVESLAVTRLELEQLLTLSVLVLPLTQPERNSLAQLLHPLTLPVLKELRVGGELTSDSVDALSNLFSRSRSMITLQVLSLDLTKLSCTDMIRLLVTVPSLRSLSIGGGWVTDEILTTLCDKSASGDRWTVLPELCDLGCFGGRKWSEDKLFEVVKSRFRHEIETPIDGLKVNVKKEDDQGERVSVEAIHTITKLLKLRLPAGTRAAFNVEKWDELCKDGLTIDWMAGSSPWTI